MLHRWILMGTGRGGKGGLAAGVASRLIGLCVMGGVLGLCRPTVGWLKPVIRCFVTDCSLQRLAASVGFRTSARLSTLVDQQLGTVICSMLLHENMVCEHVHLACIA